MDESCCEDGDGECDLGFVRGLEEEEGWEDGGEDVEEGFVGGREVCVLERGREGLGLYFHSGVRGLSVRK